MADLLPVNFPLPPEAAIVTYDFVDFASRTGYVNFYGGTVNNSSTYVLSNNVFRSQRPFTKTTSTATADTTQNDLDFDVKFASAQNIKGNVIVEVPILLRNRETGSAYDYNTYVKVYVRKWDGSTETEIANATSETYEANVGAVNSVFLLFTLKIEVSTLTHFKRDESLRITIEHHGWADAGGPSTNYCVGHDPEGNTEKSRWIVDTVSGDALDFLDSDSAITIETTQLKVQVPVRID